VRTDHKTRSSTPFEARSESVVYRQLVAAAPFARAPQKTTQDPCHMFGTGHMREILLVPLRALFVNVPAVSWSSRRPWTENGRMAYWYFVQYPYKLHALQGLPSALPGASPGLARGHQRP